MMTNSILDLLEPASSIIELCTAFKQRVFRNCTAGWLGSTIPLRSNPVVKVRINRCKQTEHSITAVLIHHSARAPVAFLTQSRGEHLSCPSELTRGLMLEFEFSKHIIM